MIDVVFYSFIEEQHLTTLIYRQCGLSFWASVAKLSLWKRGDYGQKKYFLYKAEFVGRFLSVFTILLSQVLCRIRYIGHFRW